MKEFIRNMIYTKDELAKFITKNSKIEISDVTIYKRINKMISHNELSRINNGEYIFTNKKQYSYDLTSEISKKVLSITEENFDKSTKFIVYESTILNEFLNHLIAKSTTIIEIEKNLMEQEFWLLKENGYQNVLLNPNDNENYIYNSYDGNCIIIKPLISKAPINHKEHKISIEKLIVDIICDKTTNLFYENSEIQGIFEYITKTYSFKYDTIYNYAKRRHCYEKVIKYIST